MKMHSKYRPWLAVMKDDSRPDMCHVMLDVETKRLYATNGHIAVAVGVEVTEGDKSGLLDPTFLRVLSERYLADNYDGMITIDCSSPVHVEGLGIRWPRPKVVAEYPPIESVRPKFEGKATHTFSINANLLKKLAAALGSGSDNDRDWPPANVSFTCVATETLAEPILIRLYDDETTKPDERAEAFLMPLRS